MSKTRIRSVGLAIAGALLLAPLALGAEQTRESYTAQVEPICERNAEASDRILQGVTGDVRAERLKLAAAKFAKAARALKKTLAELRAVPRPSADRAQLGRWLGYIETEVELFELTAKKLRAGDRGGALRMAARLTRTVNRANNEVLDFEFDHCYAEPSQFT